MNICFGGEKTSVCIKIAQNWHLIILFAKQLTWHTKKLHYLSYLQTPFSWPIHFYIQISEFLVLFSLATVSTHFHSKKKCFIAHINYLFVHVNAFSEPGNLSKIFDYLFIIYFSAKVNIISPVQ